MGGVGDGVGLHPRDQVVVLFERAGDDLARGIVGVGDEVAGFCDGDDAEQGEHLVAQGAAVAIGPHHALVDAEASGTAKTLAVACTSRLTAWRECPMMYSGLVFDSEC